VFQGKKELISPPTLCPDCRYRQRLMWRNERHLYHRKCSATGKQIISIFSPDKTWPPVFEQSYWWSDAWDARTYGRDMDFSRPFFEQWAELFRATPQIAMNNQMSENCEYTNQSQQNKDCYLVFCSNDSRECYHGMWNQFVTSCVDCVYIERSELCYEMLNAKNCYGCTYSQNLENCSDVSFSRNCIGCKNCIGCVNLRNKEYFIENKEYSKEAYEQKLQELQLWTHTGVTSMRERSWTFFRDFPRKFYLGAHCEDFSGDYLMNVRDTHDCYNCRNAEHLKHCQDAWRENNCQDLTETVENDFSYSIEGSAVSTNTSFSKKFYNLQNSLYCSHCNSSKNLFGCVSLNNGEYCVLNKQYTKEEYEELVPKIIDHMQKNGEWGEHFPSVFTPYGYNETVAQEYFPLTREQALSAGILWHDEEEAQKQYLGPLIEIPDSIDDVTDEITRQILVCEASSKPYKLIPQELALYRKMRVPVPRRTPDQRYFERMALRNPRKLWDGQCKNCGKAFVTTFSPDRPEIVSCEECYLQAVS